MAKESIKKAPIHFKSALQMVEEATCKYCVGGLVYFVFECD